MLLRNFTGLSMFDSLRRRFGKAQVRLQAAALPWRKTETGIEVLLITSRQTRRWVLPKGWPEDREELCDAAAREAGEEAGLAGAISRREAGRYYYRKSLSDGRAVPCEVLVYPLEVASVADTWKESRKRVRKWVSPAEAAQMVAEPDLCKVISRFCADPRTVA